MKKLIFLKIDSIFLKKNTYIKISQAKMKALLSIDRIKVNFVE